MALCFGTFPPEHNGGSDYVSALAGSLAGTGLDVTVITSPYPDAPEEEEPVPGVRVLRLMDDWSPSSRGRRSLGRANAALDDAGVELVHVFFPDSVVAERYRDSALLGIGRIPLVTTFWNLGLGRASPLGLRIASLALLARSRALTSHDPFYLAALARVAGSRRVRWLPVGSTVPADLTAGPGEARRRLELDRDASWLTYFGQMDPTRGLDDLFEALALLRRTRDVRLLMVGSAGRPHRYADSGRTVHEEFLRLRSLPERLGIGEAVRWTDYLPPEEVALHLRAADCCVLPYRRNSIGRSALAAALELGCPTVLGGTAAGIVPLRSGEHVLASPPADPKALAEAVARVLDDDALRARLAEGGHRISRVFSWPRITAAALDVYREAVAR